MFFRTRQCTRVHSLILGVQKTCKYYIWEKRVCFWSYWQIWKGHEDKIKKNACKNVYQGSIFISEKYAFRVCFKSPKPFYGDDIQWRHQNFFLGGVHRGGKMRFWGGKYPKICHKWLILAIFSSDRGGASGGKQSLRLRGECPYAPLDAATDDIQPEIQVRSQSWYMNIVKILGK